MAGWTVVGAVLLWYVMDSVADRFAGWKDLLAIYLLLIVTYYYVTKQVVPDLFRLEKRTLGDILKPLGKVLLALLLLVINFSLLTGALSIGRKGQEGKRPGIQNFGEVTLVLACSIALAFFVFAVRRAYFKGDQLKVAKKMFHVQAEEMRRLLQSWVQQDLPPHLLFNSLAAIRTLSRTDPVRASEAMTLLIDLAKYYLRRCKQPDIPLEEELAQVAQMCKLYGIRFGAELALAIHVPDGAGRLPVVPMLLILIVENISRYGVVTDPSRAASITIAVEGNRVEIEARNYIAPESGRAAKGLGIAMDTLTQQLTLRYPKGSDLRTVQEGDVFITRIFFLL